MRRFALLAALTALGLPAQAAAQLPTSVTTPPPPEHRADPSLITYVFRVGPFSIGGYQTLRRTDVVVPPPWRARSSAWTCGSSTPVAWRSPRRS